MNIYTINPSLLINLCLKIKGQETVFKKKMKFEKNWKKILGDHNSQSTIKKLFKSLLTHLLRTSMKS